MIRAIAFDLDNTLIDFMKFKRETAKAAAKAMKQKGLDLLENEIVRRIFEVYGTKGIEYQKTFAEVLRPRQLRPNDFERIQQAGILAYLKRKNSALKPFPGVKSTLSKLRKFKLAIVSDAPRNKAWQRLVACGLDGHFDVVVTYPDTGQLKPSPMPFKRLLSELKLPPSEILFVGDNPGRDIKGAKKMGMKTALAKYGQVFPGGGADFDLKKFSDILKVVK